MVFQSEAIFCVSHERCFRLWCIRWVEVHKVTLTHILECLPEVTLPKLHIPDEFTHTHKFVECHECGCRLVMTVRYVESVWTLPIHTSETRLVQKHKHR